MDAKIDIRDQAHLSGENVLTLNFIREQSPFTFRKYYRSGLRSHIFEVVKKKDIDKEIQGEVVDGIRIFPRAEPVKMFRIFRQRFVDIESIFREIKKYNLLLKWLGKKYIATSQEFIVDYTLAGKSQILFCGLQEYVKGNVLDPWRLFNKECLADFFRNTQADSDTIQMLFRNIEDSIRSFIKRIRVMVTRTGFIPDLAGNGNLIVTPHGHLKLVDINNIVRIHFDDIIRMDDKGYPSCDVSIQVLSMLERIVLGTEISETDPFYGKFLSSERKEIVKDLEEKFYANLKKNQKPPLSSK